MKGPYGPPRRSRRGEWRSTNAGAVPPPRRASSASSCSNNRIHKLHPIRMKGMFAIRPAVKHGELSAAFEAVIWIQDEHRKVLGRDDENEIGWF